MEFMTWARAQWDRVSAWVLVGIGALALVLGWIGVTGTPYVFEQIPYVISGGLGGLFLLGLGAMLWISADLRDEWRKLDQLVRLQEALLSQQRDDIGESADVPELPAPANGARPARRTRSAEVP